MIRLAVRVRASHAELALAELLELAPDGVEEVDLGDVVEYAVYGDAAALPAATEVASALGEAFVTASTSEVADDWSERWREFHQPLSIGGRLRVRPPWIAPDGSQIDLVIDPGQAFGTGAHATTALCLEMLLDLELPPPADRRAVDLGCGSGVLAILAARLGWGPVTALDHDELAVTATRENAQVNQVALGGVHRFDLREETVPAAALVLANLLAPLLLTWADAMARTDERPDTIIASGLLVAEADTVSSAFAERGYVESDRGVKGDWAALKLRSHVL